MTNIAAVGAGYWGPNLIRNLVSSSKGTLKTVCDLDEKKLEKISKLYPAVKITTNYDDVLKDSEIDAVVIATNPGTHSELALKALEAGKHVFVEKPMALSSKEGEQMVKLANEKKLVLMTGHTFVYNAAVRKLKELAESGELGEVLYVYGSRLNLGLYQKETNVVWDLGPHDVSILLYLLGKHPKGVSAITSWHVMEGREDVAFINLRFNDHSVCNLHLSWLDPNKVRQMVVVGSKKMAVFDDVEPLEKIKIFDKSVEQPSESFNFGEFNMSYRYGDIVIPKLESTEPLRIETDHFIECIKEGKKPVSSGEEGLEVIRILEAVEESSRQNGKEVLL